MADSTSGTAADPPIPPPGSPLNDPEFAGGSRGLAPEPWDRNLYPDDDLRMVVNPFIAVFALAGTIVTARWMARQWSLADGPLLALILLALACSAASVAFGLHCHCLDCGRTVGFWRWKSHSCERVRARRVLGRRRRLVGPKPFLQALIWIIILLAVVLLYDPIAWVKEQLGVAAPATPPQPR